MRIPPLLALTTVLFAAGAEEPTSDDARALQGTWTMISVTVDGATGTEEEVRTARLVVRRDRFDVTFDGRPIPCTVALNPSANPKTIDLTYTTGDVKGRTVRGIYRLQGDTFVLCRTLRPRDDRPAEFGSDAGSMHVLAAWARAKP